MATEDKVPGSYDFREDIKKFHETKADVQGLVDSGIAKIPQIFLHPSDDLPKEPGMIDHRFHVPIIDLEGVDDERRKSVVEEIRRASDSWGFFQIVNHGVPLHVLDEMIEGVRKFHEQPVEEKQKIYSDDILRKVRCFSRVASFLNKPVVLRESLSCRLFAEDLLNPDELPTVCRDIIIEYLKYVITLKDTLSKLLSEALGLNSDYLKQLECMESRTLIGHYYIPACPEPNETFGTPPHADPNFLTVLLQDQIGGLQVLHQNQWVDVCPKKGALIVNFGDLLQLVANDEFKSVVHRVLANSASSRISIATFFNPKSRESKYGPIKELLSIDNPPKYSETSASDYVAFFMSKELEGTSRLAHLKL